MLIKPHTLNKAKLSDDCQEDVLLENDTGVLYNCYSVLRLYRNMEGERRKISLHTIPQLRTSC